MKINNTHIARTSRKYGFLYYAVFLIPLFCAFGGCNKFLEKKTDYTLVTPSTLADAQALLDDAARMNIGRTPSYGENANDDYFMLPANYNKSTVGIQKLYTWQQFSLDVGNDWSYSYLPVYNANLSLEIAQQAIVNKNDSLLYKNVVGSAHFFRAFYFAGLLWDYAKAYDSTSSNTDLGIVIRTSSDFNIHPGRTSVAASLEQIIEDAKLATQFLPNLPIHTYRPSSAAAFALLARIYLFMRKYDQSLLCANEALKIKSDLMDFNGDKDINGSLTTSVPFKKFNREIIFYTEQNKFYAMNIPSKAKIDTSLYGLYSNTDLRKTAFFKVAGGYYQFKGNYTADAFTFFSGLTTDELYLITAECYARLGNVLEAKTKLNQLLKRRFDKAYFHPVETADEKALIDTILLERRKELLMRGIRWGDIKRLNKEGRNIRLQRNAGGIIYELYPNDPFFALPIPNDLIAAGWLIQN